MRGYKEKIPDKGRDHVKRCLIDGKASSHKGEEMRELFYPESVAVVGASSGEKNMGKNIVENLLNWGYKGKIFPVNPRGEDVFGLRGYRSIPEIGERVDLAVAFVPAKAVPAIMDSCAECGIKWMAIPSGGFSEYGPQGEELTRVIKEKAEKYSIRFVGPNGLTIINTENGLCLPFLTLKKREYGPISIISQSGGVGLSLIMFLDNSCVGFSKFISVGNKVNMDELDFLEYLAEDESTKVICMFLESVVKGRRFLEVASRVDKPIIVYKANVTEFGARTAASHTAALANNDEVLNGVFRQAGIIRVDTIKRLIETARGFALPPIRGNRVAVISQAGGYTVLLADEVYKKGFALPGFSSSTIEGLKAYVRSDVIRLSNPLDLGDIHSADAIVYAMDRALGEEQIDGAVVVLLRRADAKYTGAYSALSREIYSDIGRIMEKHNKPIALCLLTQADYLKNVQRRMSYPIFETPEDAVTVLAALRDFYSQSRINSKS